MDLQMKNNKLVQINEGQYYLFFNFHKGLKNITLGFPYKNSKQNDAYIAVNGVEQGRISYFEANKYLSQSLLSVLPIHRVKGISSRNLVSSPEQIVEIVHCKLCKKQLRGNLSKVICIECFNRLGHPVFDHLEQFQKLNRSYFETLELALTNYTIEDISIERELGISTIINHLEKLSPFVNFEKYKNLQPNPIFVSKLKLLIQQRGRVNTLTEFRERLKLEISVEISFNEIRHCLFYIDNCC
jgi:hypothetical protein